MASCPKDYEGQTSFAELPNMGKGAGWLLAEFW